MMTDYLVHFSKVPGPGDRRSCKFCGDIQKYHSIRLKKHLLNCDALSEKNPDLHRKLEFKYSNDVSDFVNKRRKRERNAPAIIDQNQIGLRANSAFSRTLSSDSENEGINEVIFYFDIHICSGTVSLLKLPCHKLSTSNIVSGQ